ncbi:MAG: glycosyltransferase family 4 protein [Lachnospiraceae bacterium]|nr:glycosyltransferase family 4 protein [Lachnospiraceae bacterium]
MIEIDNIYPKTGIFKAIDIYPEFFEYSDCLDLNKTFILNRVSRNKKTISNIVSYFSLILFLLRHKADFIYTTIIFHVIDWPLYMFTNKIFSAFHDPIPHSSTNVAKNIQMYQHQINKVKKCVIFNSFTKDEFIQKFNIAKDKLYVSQIGLNDLMCKFKSRKDVDLSNPYILFWGRIEPYKGVEYLLDAMLQVHNEYPDLNLVIAGRGKIYFDDKPYKNLDYITFYNRFLSITELADLVDGCKYVVCPYKDATQSGVITTAFAFNKPVIGTNVGAIPEYVIDGRLGIIVPPSDSKALASAIEKIESDSYLYAYLTKNIENYYQHDNGSWECISDNLIKIFE